MRIKRKSPLADGLHIVRTKSKLSSQAWTWFVVESGQQTVGAREVGYSSPSYAREQAHFTLSGGFSYLLDGGK